MSGSLCLPARILKVYIKALPGFGPDSVQLLSTTDCSLEPVGCRGHGASFTCHIPFPILAHRNHWNVTPDHCHLRQVFLHGIQFL